MQQKQDARKSMDSSCGSLRYLRGNRACAIGASAHEREAAHVHVSLLAALCATRKERQQILHESAGLEGGVVRCRDAAAPREGTGVISRLGLGWLEVHAVRVMRGLLQKRRRLGCEHAAVDEHAPAVRREDAVHHRVVLRGCVRAALNDEHARGETSRALNDEA